MKIEEQADILLNRCNDANGATYVFNVEDVRAVAQLALCKPVVPPCDATMTRRDRFAMSIIPAIVEEWSWGFNTVGKENDIKSSHEATMARWAYSLADAMEKARVQK